MTFDLLTLMVAGSFVSAVSGAFLIFAALQTKESEGMLWWASANLTLAAAIPMIAVPHLSLMVPSVVVAITLLNLSPALVWASARACNGHPVDIGAVGSGAGVWLVAITIPAVRASEAANVGLNLAIAAVFLFAAALEFWRGRNDRITARGPLIVLLILHGIFATGGAIGAVIGALTPINGTVILTWLGFVHFETLAFVIGTSIFTVAMARERQELQERINANTDSLTGLATRRAFYEEASQILSKSRETGTPASIILFDLDRFKAINDTFGHGPGDEVLRAFGQTSKKMLRATDLIGRIGGEEFAVVLPGAGLEAAYLVAERTRVAFTSATAGIGEFTATLSAGVARADAGATVDTLLKAADDALYRAKSAGRNRVEIGGGRDAARPAAPAAAAPAFVQRQVA
jgi:diguanylate cyclase (GGDEF)-like protein